MMRERIEEAVKEALAALGAGGASFVVERPGDLSHGDYATNAALAAAKILKKNPKEVAEALIKVLRSSTLLGPNSIEKIEFAGAGFINFFLSGGAVWDVVGNAIDEGWGTNHTHAGKEILVEYTSPNLFKPLHIGNLVGNIVGESVSRLFEYSGAVVRRLNYPSDIGLTVAKGVWGLWKQSLDPRDIAQLGKAYVAGNAAYEDGSAKEEIETINKALYEDSSEEWSALRKQGIETSRTHLDTLCKKLGTTFDKEFFESESGPAGRDIVHGHIGNVFKESEGAVIFSGAHTRVFLNSQGLPTYEAKEVGLFELKSQAYPNFDLSFTVTGSEQKEFFTVVFEAIRKVFPDKTKGKGLEHIANGFLRLTTGKMSSRLGNVITGESLLADVTEAARGREDVAVGAIKYTVLRSGNGKDIVFDPTKSLSIEGDSGPYLQYALVRARSLMKKVEEEAEVVDNLVTHDKDFAEFGAAVTLGRTLIHFPDAVARAAEEKEPHHVVTYLTELAAVFNSWYATERVIVDGKVADYTLNIVKAVENTLAKGLHVLGIPAPQEM